MKTFLSLTAVLAISTAASFLAAAAFQDDAKVKNKSSVEQIAIFGFEGEKQEAAPKNWTKKGSNEFSAIVSDGNPNSGERCLKISSRAEGAGMNPTGALNYLVEPGRCRGKRIRFRSSINANFGDEGQVVMWLREDLKSGGKGAFDSMADRPIKISDWSQHEIVADISKEAKAITVGFLMFGKGEVLVDDIVIEVVDESVALTIREGGQGPMGVATAAPGLFEINGSMEVRADLRQLDQAKKGKDVRLLLPLPLLYRSQYPLTYNLSANPPEALASVKIYEDKPNNFVAEVVLQDFTKHKKVEIKFNSAIMVLPSTFSNIPETAALPEAWPDEAKPWLASTWCVDSDNDRIKEIAKEIRSESDDVLKIIGQVETRAKAIFGSATGSVQNLTAVEALDKRGSCTSCGNLVAALLRSAGIPARVLAGYPSWSGPLQTHYIVEAYIPDYGWYPIESTMCRSPWPNQNQINVAIIAPEYESQELAGQRRGVAGGVPYLSLTEIRENDGSFYTVGTIPKHEFSDHECRFIRKFESDESDWRAAVEWSTPRWEAWLRSQPEIVEGKIMFGPMASEIKADSPAKLVTEFGTNR